MPLWQICIVDPFGVKLIGWDPLGCADKMSRFHGYRTCNICSEACTPGNFLDHEGKRYCTACWIAKENPDSENIEETREGNRLDAKKWKRQKYNRNEGPLPVGPQSIRKD